MTWSTSVFPKAKFHEKVNTVSIATAAGNQRLWYSMISDLPIWKVTFDLCFPWEGYSFIFCPTHFTKGFIQKGLCGTRQLFHGPLSDMYLKLIIHYGKLIWCLVIARVPKIILNIKYFYKRPGYMKFIFFGSETKYFFECENIQFVLDPQGINDLSGKQRERKLLI